MNRRSLLATIAGVGAVPTVGCLGDDDPAAGDDDPAASDDDPNRVAPESISVEYDASGSTPSSFGDLGGDEDARAFHATPETGGETFSLDESSDDDFLLYVETRAPNSCYGLRIESLAMTPERVLTGTVRARDTSTEREGCASSVTTPSRLARVRTEPAPPTHALLDVIDGWGEAHEVRSVPPQ